MSKPTSHTPPHPVPAPVRIACTADLCRQGRTEIALMCIAIVAVAAVLLFAIKACAIA